jgi:hypothetical protein
MARTLGAIALASLAWAQSPYSALPKYYSLEFENDSVRVSRVRFFPGDKLPLHSHPSLPTVYIYLTDGGPVRFIHKTPRFTLERPAVKAGSVRFNRNARVETHEVEYLGDAWAEYLRVEPKTVPGPPHRDARLREDTDFPWEDPQLRIHRGVPSGLVGPALVVNPAGHNFTWLDPGQSPSLPGPPDPAGFVVLELKTKPIVGKVRGR